MKQPIAVLFLCTHNSARSILAEALLNALSNGKFIGYSAGSTPRATGQPNPLALRTLQHAGIDTRPLRSKSWAEFLGPAAPHLDLVITVCGNADEACPLFPGTPAKIHWGYDDPSAGDAPDDDKMRAFEKTFQAIRKRLEALVNLPSEALSSTHLAQSAQQLSKAF
ncbi:MAG: arsenate reductase ArsC [Pseudomonadota bacterium]